MEAILKPITIMKICVAILNAYLACFNLAEGAEGRNKLEDFLKNDKRFSSLFAQHVTAPSDGNINYWRNRSFSELGIGADLIYHTGNVASFSLENGKNTDFTTFDFTMSNKQICVNFKLSGSATIGNVYFSLLENFVIVYEILEQIKLGMINHEMTHKDFLIMFKSFHKKARRAILDDVRVNLKEWIMLDNITLDKYFTAEIDPDDKLYESDEFIKKTEILHSNIINCLNELSKLKN